MFRYTPCWTPYGDSGFAVLQAGWPGMPPFTGGGVGISAMTPLLPGNRFGENDTGRHALAELLFCQSIIIMDHLTHSTTLIHLALTETGKDPARQYEDAVCQLEAIAGSQVFTGTAKYNADMRSPGCRSVYCRHSTLTEMM